MPENIQDPSSEVKPKEEFDNPLKFLASFRNSKEYQEVLSQYMGKVSGLNSEQRESRKSFFESLESCEQILANFGRGRILRFDPEVLKNIPNVELINSLLNAYWDLIRKKRFSLRYVNREDNFSYKNKNLNLDLHCKVSDDKAYDEVRSELHRRISGLLVDSGLAPNDNFARWLVVFFTRAEGLEISSPTIWERISTEEYNALYNR